MCNLLADNKIIKKYFRRDKMDDMNCLTQISIFLIKYYDK